MAEKADIEKMRLVTGEARISHPHVFKPTKIKPTEPERYSVELLFDKKTTKLSDFQAPVIAAATAKWGADRSQWPKPLDLPYRDGDKPYGKKKEIKKEHVGMWVVRASCKAEFGKPYVVGKDPKIALTSEAEFYPGCYGRAALKANAYVFGQNEGVSFILDGVQFIRDGEPLGSKKPADQMFGVIEGDAGEEGFGLDANEDEIPF